MSAVLENLQTHDSDQESIRLSYRKWIFVSFRVRPSANTRPWPIRRRRGTNFTLGVDRPWPYVHELVAHNTRMYIEQPVVDLVPSLLINLSTLEQRHGTRWRLRGALARCLIRHEQLSWRNPAFGKISKSGRLEPACSDNIGPGCLPVP